MARKVVMLQVSRKTRDVVKDATTKKKNTQGTAKENKYLLPLLLDEKIISRFNIPTYENTEGGTIAFTNRSGGSRLRFSGIDDTTGTPITFTDSDFAIALKRGRVKSARFKSGIVAGKVQRTTSIPFPQSFTNLMILQALGTMIRAKEPDFIRIGASAYPFVKIAGDGASALLKNAQEGAWVIGSGGSVTDDPNDNTPREDPALVIGQASLDLGT